MSGAVARSRRLLLLLTMLLALGLSVVVPGTSLAGAATRDVDQLVRDLAAKGLRLDVTERACVAQPAPAAPTASKPSALDVLLGCVSQEHAVTFVVARWTATGATASEAACLTRRLRLATWPEVSEAVRSAVEEGTRTTTPTRQPDANTRVLAPAAVSTRTILASRLAPYASSCAVSASTRGTKLPSLSLAQFTGRWNAAVARQPGVLTAITALEPAPSDPSSSSGVSTSMATVAEGTTLGINTNAAGVTGAYVGIHGARATPAATAAALDVLSEVVEGRDRAASLRRAVDVTTRFARFDRITAYIGHAAYTVTVTKQPRAVLIVVTW